MQKISKVLSCIYSELLLVYFGGVCFIKLNIAIVKGTMSFRMTEFIIQVSKGSIISVVRYVWLLLDNDNIVHITL